MKLATNYQEQIRTTKGFGKIVTKELDQSSKNAGIQN